MSFIMDMGEQFFFFPMEQWCEQVLWTCEPSLEKFPLFEEGEEIVTEMKKCQWHFDSVAENKRCRS